MFTILVFQGLFLLLAGITLLITTSKRKFAPNQAPLRKRYEMLGTALMILGAFILVAMAIIFTIPMASN